LFFNPTNTVSLDAGSPAGNLTLTASGLGFLAGYGAEAFFRFVDSILRLVFAERPATSGATSVPQSPPAAPQSPPAPAPQQGPQPVISPPSAAAA